MKTLRFNFMHPVKGLANLVPQSGNNNKAIHIIVDSRGSDLLEIPLEQCGEGKWEIILEWEHDGQNYSHHKDFKIEKGIRVFSSR